MQSGMSSGGTSCLCELLCKYSHMSHGGGCNMSTDEGIVLYIRRLCVSLCTRWSRLRSALSEELSR